MNSSFPEITVIFSLRCCLPSGIKFNECYWRDLSYRKM